MRNNRNIFFITYEEMKRDLKDVIERLCKFLGINELNECEMNQLLEYLSFDNMKNKESINPTWLIKQTLGNVPEGFQFMRRGVVGAYKEELNTNQRVKIDHWSNTHLKPYGIREADIFGAI
ncbi:amine sulfotransferase-like [Drosophila albomicans]|uniref:Amine sulfotransferase-like n=1 Tax=Drosophila albomicans TaxID=7291 RepID=A0A6P8X7F8_DROAB|nr:amine sulfotransferase-like [Drosophila albomicans]